MGDSATGAAELKKLLFRFRNVQSPQPHIRSRMGKIGRKPATKARLIYDKYAKQETEDASLN